MCCVELCTMDSVLGMGGLLVRQCYSACDHGPLAKPGLPPRAPAPCCSLARLGFVQMNDEHLGGHVAAQPMESRAGVQARKSAAPRECFQTTAFRPPTHQRISNPFVAVTIQALRIWSSCFGLC